MIFILTAIGFILCTIGIIYCETETPHYYVGPRNSDFGMALFLGCCGFCVFPIINIALGIFLIIEVHDFKIKNKQFRSDKPRY